MTGDAIQLSRNGNSVGRATYSQPLHLWDKASSRNLTDFTTHISFSIDSQNSSQYGDGMAFFLVPNGSNLPENSGGGSLGLTGPFYPNMTSTDNPFVAVEFDIFSNHFEPPYTHVGIDITSLKSVTDLKWWSNTGIMEGWRQKATVSYDSQAKNLSVAFTGWSDRTEISQRLSYIVDLRDHLPEFVAFGFSASTGVYTSIYTIYSWSFKSGPVLDGDETNTADINSIKTARKTGRLIAFAVGGSVFVLVLVLLVCYFQKRKYIANRVDDTFEVAIGNEFEQYNGAKKFMYKDLKQATNNFRRQNMLGEGGFGGVYKGLLKANGPFVAVKRVSGDSNQGVKEYASEVKTISRLRHRNLVHLIGWCHEKKQLLLVYEFMPNGSLDYHLFKGKSLLSWRIRFKIAQGLASALLYLHEEWEQCVVHRDIKSSNVMLDVDFNAKLGDFGLARLVDHEKGSRTTTLAGTMGYMAPECVMTGKANKETDVFSFGIVALEIACGRKPIDHKAEESRVNLVEWVWSLYGEGKILDAGDPKLNGDFNSREMEHLMIVGLWCTHPDSSFRPSIRQALLLLKFEAPLPLLPLRMPEASYGTPGEDMACYGTSSISYT